MYSVSLSLIERLFTITDGTAGIRRCVLIGQRAAERRTAPMDTRPCQILHKHFTHTSYQRTWLFKTVVCVCFYTLHWQVKHGSSVANTSLPISVAVQLLRGSETQTTRIKQSSYKNIHFKIKWSGEAELGFKIRTVMCWVNNGVGCLFWYKIYSLF